MNTSLHLRHLLSLLLVFLCLTPAYPLRAAVIYVDAGATGANNGSSWADAYNYLQDALTAAGSGSDIWVAQGTYKPDANTSNPGGTNDRTATFQLKNGVALYGSFPTGGGSRDPNTYTTTLSGDINVPDNNSDNSYHVVTGSGTNSTAVLDGFTITKGYADGSPPDNRGAGMYNYSGSPTLTNCIFSSNSARGYQESRYGAYGGGMYNEGSSPTLTKCTFSQNMIFSQMADGYGAGMYNTGGSPILNNCIFSGNNVTGDDSDGYGGGMCNSDSSPTLTNCTFSGNEATSTLFRGYGGGIYNAGGSSNITITNCTFSGNSAGSDYGGYGGGIYNNCSSSNITNCSFSGNVATSCSSSLGGGIYNSGGSHTLTNCAFSGNEAWGDYDGLGGGIYSTGSSPTLTNCSFINNSAISYMVGGGQGGGIYNTGGILTLSDCNFSGNWVFGDSGNYGGGICAGGSTLINCTFYNNRAVSMFGESYAGAMYADGSTLTNCTFSGNFADSGHSSSYGGGMYTGGSTLTNCTFSGNRASGGEGGCFGGGMYACGSTLANCAFTGNIAISFDPDGNFGGGIYNAVGSSVVTNCILWANIAIYGPQIYGSATVSYSDVQGGWTGTGNINADPLFVDADGPDNTTGTEDDNLRLSPGSPCIDAGDNTAVPIGIETDLDGRDRFTDGDCNTTVIVDMGAFEFTHAYFGDFDSDCDVDFLDYAIQANSWLTDEFLVDIAPTPAGDGLVDTSDLAVLCDNWLADF